MGLDMYASRRLHVKQWEHHRPEERYKVQIEYGGKPLEGIQADRISDVEEEVMYWRKANHIHGWFVDNVQAGEDKCRPYYVHYDQIARLGEVCEKVIKASKLVKGKVWNGRRYDEDHPKGIDQWQPGKVIDNPSVAKKLLPTRSGCFFGSLQYDEQYLNDVIETRDWAKRMLTDEESGVPGDIYYSSSW